VELAELFRHATLHWDSPGSPLRREVEATLARQLRRCTTPEHDLGLWLTLVGLLLSTGSVLVTFALYVRSLLMG
jgi:hypothetical protein